ncbi:MAG: CinA family protein [Bacteroidetes bacterium]|nr:CinA family protein [Bacteroidota bacterium]
MYRTPNPLIKTLLKKELTLALAESITCGLAAHQLSTCKGTADVFKGSIVCYNEEVKRYLFGITQKMIDKHTCESKEVTEALAKKLSGLIKADIYAAITGLASAGGSETKTKPVGTVFYCIKYGRKIYNERFVFRGTPLEIRKKACDTLYKMILKKIEL